MTTLSDIRASLRNLLTDKTQWRDSLLNSWVQDAVRDYSLYFPLLVQTTIDCVAAQKTYDLSSYTLYAMRSVEYPTGEMPRRRSTLSVRMHCLTAGHMTWQRFYADIARARRLGRTSDRLRPARTVHWRMAPSYHPVERQRADPPVRSGKPACP
jgi:hypothetical protein